MAAANCRSHAGAQHSLLHAALIGFDHLLDHLAADGAGLLGRQIAVIALLQGNAHLRGRLHLEAVHGLTGAGIHNAGTGHGFSLPRTLMIPDAIASFDS